MASMERLLTKPVVLLPLALSFIGIIVLGLFITEWPKASYKVGVSAAADKAVDQARQVYFQKKAAGIDFSDGPCLTNDLLTEWVADLVHNPRTSVDDLAKNQCQALIEGRAKHFVELDLDGEVVRVE